MLYGLLNRAKVNTATTGTGTVTLGTAVSPYQTWAAANARDNMQYEYLIEDGTAWEYGFGTYSLSGGTVTRNLIASSTGSLLSLSGTATIACVSGSTDGFFQTPIIEETGRYYPPDTMTFNSGTAAVTANTMYFYPFSRRILLSAIGIEVTTAVAASAVRAGIYSMGPKGLPANLIEEGTPIATTGTGIKDVVLAASRRMLEPFWLAVCYSHAITVRNGTIDGDAGRIMGMTTLNLASTAAANRITAAFTYGAFPADTTGLTLATASSTLTAYAKAG